MHHHASNHRQALPVKSMAAQLRDLMLGLALVRLVRFAYVPAEAEAIEPRNTGADVGEKQHASRQSVREIGRGRRAETRAQIPVRGWKDIAWRVYEQFSKDRVMSVAAGVTYYALLALFPAVAALVSIYGLFADPGTIESHLTSLSAILPGGALDVIGEQVRRIAAKGGGTLGVGFILGLVISLWTANAGMKALFDALNIVYDEQEKRSFIALNAQSLAFTLGGMAFILVAIGGIVALPVALGFLGLSSATEWLLSLGRWPLLLIAVTPSSSTKQPRTRLKERPSPWELDVQQWPTQSGPRRLERVGGVVQRSDLRGKTACHRNFALRRELSFGLAC